MAYLSRVITPEDPDLAARVRAGNRTAIQTVVETYFPQILQAARGAGLAPQEAEDVTQATFTTFIEAAPRFEGRSSVRTWLFGILYKKIAEARRARQRDRQMEEIDEAFDSRVGASGKWSTPPQPVDTDLHHKQVETEIFICLDAAPLRQALAFILREVEELSTEDISSPFPRRAFSCGSTGALPPRRSSTSWTPSRGSTTSWRWRKTRC